jgi:Zn-dependent protease
MSFLDPHLLLPAVPVILFALTVHEWAHAYTADRLGDPTARLMGRMTLNPLAHLDLFGTIAIVLIGFGWAKPVPVNPNNLRDPRRQMMWIAAAGPASNLAQALLFGLLFQFVHAGGSGAVGDGFFIRMISYGVFINCALAVFNLIPVPPLDGSKIIYGLWPGMTAEAVFKLERYGPAVLMGLIFFGFLTGYSVLWSIMGPPVHLLTGLLSGGAL